MKLPALAVSETPIGRYCKMTGRAMPVMEFRFAPPRRWRFDFAWIDRMIAFEIEGGIWVGGRHTTGTGFKNDIEKYNEAALLGWMVLRATTDQVSSGEAFNWIERALAK